jgi:DNA-binding transcriptional ArsR family regulator
MPTVMELGIADLAGTRFAISPLSETAKAIHVLGGGKTPALNRPWLDWARARLSETPLRMPRLWPLIHTGTDYTPEFLVPAPAGQRPTLEDELDRMRATPEEPVRASLHRVFGTGQWPDSATELYQDPAGSLAEIAAEYTEFYERLIAPHWERIRSVLDADVIYRTGLLASGGARALFGDMHPDLHWTDGLLSVDDRSHARTQVWMGPDGIVLLPSVFNWPNISTRKATSSQTTLMYPARGAATVWHTLSDALSTRLPVISELIGVTRARMLDTLQAPATTSALARQFAVTPGAVSQHLSVMHRAGLLTRQRSGRSVLYQTSELGLALLAVRSTEGS